jgi:hypothetical protein
MSLPVANPSGEHLQTTQGTVTVLDKPCRLIGIIASSGTSPTARVFDNTAASGTVAIETVALAVGFNSLPITLKRGLTVVIGGTTVQATIVYDPS